MPIEHIIIMLVVLLALALASQPIATLIRLPYPSVLVIVGFVVSEIVVFAGIDTGIRSDNYQSLVFFVFIPVLVFEAAYRLDNEQLIQDIVPILFMAIVGMFATCALTAVGLYYGIGHTTGFPWIAALLAGAILASTDPAAVVVKLKELKTPKRLTMLLEGESLFNDASAIVLFSLFLSIATATVAIEKQNTVNILINFFIVFAGGALSGVIIGYTAGLIDRFMSNALMSGMLTLIVAYGSFIFAEQLHVSGVMSTLMAGIIMSAMIQKQKSYGDSVVNQHIWDMLQYIANAILFLLVGVVITLNMFEERWLAMLIAIAAVLLARVVSIYGGLSLLALVQKKPVSTNYQTVIVWGGLRGAVTLALALSLPTTLDYWWTIQSIAFGVVLFTLFVQAPTIRLVVKQSGIRS